MIVTLIMIIMIMIMIMIIMKMIIQLTSFDDSRRKSATVSGGRGHRRESASRSLQCKLLTCAH